MVPLVYKLYLIKIIGHKLVRTKIYLLFQLPLS